MRYVNKKMVVVINKLVTELSGGMATHGTNLRPGQSLGFVERIFYNEVFGQQIYPSVYHQAAAYMYHIIKNHLFIDGNKRTGLCTAITFLEWNDILLAPFNEDEVFRFVITIAAGDEPHEIVIDRIAGWLKEMCLS
ncbi:MAG: type II toxin-antitoxin system death-on-curing family toxin [Candidatus Cloacimonetes bacterium]|nr:type II toxin-antitoxin system death-on-curing family toxin [Candidatus Cloacimonadota bacterium]